MKVRTYQLVQIKTLAVDSMYITRTPINDTLYAEATLIKHGSNKNSLNTIQKHASDFTQVAKHTRYSVYVYNEIGKLRFKQLNIANANDNSINLKYDSTYTFIVIAQRIPLTFPNYLVNMVNDGDITTAQIPPHKNGILFFKKTFKLTSKTNYLDVIFKPYFSTIVGSINLHESLPGFIRGMPLPDIRKPSTLVGVKASDQTPIYGNDFTDYNNVYAFLSSLEDQPTRTVPIIQLTQTIGSPLFTVISGPETSSGQIAITNFKLFDETKTIETTIPEVLINNLHFKPGYFYTLNIDIKAGPIGAGATNKNNVTEQWIDVNKTIPVNF